jgi:hypothetical protein
VTLYAFLGPDEHLKVFECPVAVWSVISEDHLSSNQGDYVIMTANVTQLKLDSTRKDVEKIVKRCLCAEGDAGEKGTFDSILSLKYFIQAVNFRWPIKKLTVSPEVSVVLLWPHRNFLCPL